MQKSWVVIEAVVAVIEIKDLQGLTRGRFCDQ